MCVDKVKFDRKRVRCPEIDRLVVGGDLMVMHFSQEPNALGVGGEARVRKKSGPHLPAGGSSRLHWLDGGRPSLKLSDDGG